MAAQRTGTQILQYARYLAGDNDSNSYGVDATYALELLNDLLLVWSDSIINRPTRISATTSGLTYAAGEVTKDITGSVDAASIISVHQSNAASVPTVLAERLEYLRPEEMEALQEDDGSGILAASRQQSGDWQYWSFHKTADSQDRYRVLVWPALNRTAYLTVVAPVQLALSAITETPDISPAHARYVARLLAYDIARHNEMPDQWCDRILSRVPEEILVPVLGRAVRVTQQAGSIRSVED